MSATDSLTATDGTLLTSEEITTYHSIVGGLQYLLITRLDLSFAVNKVCRFLQAPRITHWSAVKRILRYVSSIVSYGLHFRSSPSSCLHSLMLTGLEILMTGDPRGDMPYSMVLT
jgi:histone deacetylase 1/2